MSLLTVLFFLLLILTLPSCSASKGNPDNEGYSRYYNNYYKEHFIEKERKIELEALNLKIIKNIRKRTKGGMYSFPSYYGGSYIEDNNENLIICLTGDSVTSVRQFKKYQANPYIKFKIVKYNYTYLSTLKDSIIKIIPTLPFYIRNNISDVGIEAQNNAVYIYLENDSQKCINTLRGAMKFPPGLAVHETGSFINE